MGGVAEAYTMPGCFHCQQVISCCCSILQLKHTWLQLSSEMCVESWSRFPFLFFCFFHWNQLSVFGLIKKKKKSSTPPSWRDNGVSSQIVRGRYATLPSPGSPWCSFWRWLVNATFNLSLFSPPSFSLLIFLALNWCVKYCAFRWGGRRVSQHH